MSSISFLLSQLISFSEYDVSPLLCRRRRSLFVDDMIEWPLLNSREEDLVEHTDITSRLSDTSGTIDSTHVPTSSASKSNCPSDVVLLLGLFINSGRKVLSGRILIRSFEKLIFVDGFRVAKPIRCLNQATTNRMTLQNSLCIQEMNDIGPNDGTDEKRREYFSLLLDLYMYVSERADEATALFFLS
jgi:hypothetical protein